VAGRIDIFSGSGDCAVYPDFLYNWKFEKAIPGRTDKGTKLSISQQQINISQQLNCFGILDRL